MVHDNSAYDIPLKTLRRKDIVHASTLYFSSSSSPGFIHRALQSTDLSFDQERHNGEYCQSRFESN